MTKLPELQPQHYEWILAAAAEHFAEEVIRLEVDVMRLQHFISFPSFRPSGMKSQDRNKEIARTNDSLAKYRAICEWLSITREDLREKITQESAVGISDFIRERHHLPLKSAPAAKSARKKK